MFCLDTLTSSRAVQGPLSSLINYYYYSPDHVPVVEFSRIRDDNSPWTALGEMRVSGKTVYMVPVGGVWWGRGGGGTWAPQPSPYLHVIVGFFSLAMAWIMLPQSDHNIT